MAKESGWQILRCDPPNIPIHYYTSGRVDMPRTLNTMYPGQTITVQAKSKYDRSRLYACAYGAGVHVKLIYYPEESVSGTVSITFLRYALSSRQKQAKRIQARERANKLREQVSQSVPGLKCFKGWRSAPKPHTDVDIFS